MYSKGMMFATNYKIVAYIFLFKNIWNLYIILYKNYYKNSFYILRKIRGG
jgi:hypothetical protein